MIFKGHKLTIGLDLGDRWLFYCVLDEAGQIILEQKLPTTPEAMKQTFGKIPRSLMALETGTHSPWVSRLLLKQAGINNLRIHDLRRSLGSWMASTGANMVATQRALGHKTIAVSLVYQRLAQDPVRAAMQTATSELVRLANRASVSLSQNTAEGIPLNISYHRVTSKSRVCNKKQHLDKLARLKRRLS